MIARSILFHEGTHALGDEIIKDHRVIASAVGILSLTETIREKSDAPIFSSPWSERMKTDQFISAYWQELHEGYEKMRTFLLQRTRQNWEALIAACQDQQGDQKPESQRYDQNGENYSRSVRLGGMAVALMEFYPIDSADPTGGIPWAFIRGLGEGKPVTKALSDIGLLPPPQVQTDKSAPASPDILRAA